MAKREIAERIDGELTVEASTPCPKIADARRERDAAHDHRAVRSLVPVDKRLPPMRAPPARAPAAVPLSDERRWLERDLHDGVQNELVALIVKLALAQENAGIPPALAETLAGLEARAQAALDSVRDIAHGIYPPLLDAFGFAEALLAQGARSAVDVSLVGTAPLSIEAAEEAVCFACSEAIQNAAKYARRGTRITLRLRHHQGSVAVRIGNDGQGFDPARTSNGAGLGNSRDRVEDLGGTCNLASSPEHGTVLTISLRWPTAADGRR